MKKGEQTDNQTDVENRKARRQTGWSALGPVQSHRIKEIASISLEDHVHATVFAHVPTLIEQTVPVHRLLIKVEIGTVCLNARWFLFLSFFTLLSTLLP